MRFSKFIWGLDYHIYRFTIKLQSIELKEEFIMKKLFLFVILIILSVSLFADPNENLHNGDESVIPPTEVQCENI